jgi:hypothetical protein
MSQQSSFIRFGKTVYKREDIYIISGPNSNNLYQIYRRDIDGKGTYDYYEKDSPEGRDIIHLIDSTPVAAVSPYIMTAAPDQFH